jgi:colanic acid biosynthesis glycosyl transferase WcaI
MRIYVHDYSGHPFQAQLSRELAFRGHEVVHSTCAAYVSGKGDLQSRQPNLSYATIGSGRSISKMRFVRRFFQECGLGLELSRQIREKKPDVVMLSNVPIPTLVVAVASLRVRRVPWVLWQQDVQAVALRTFAEAGISPALKAVVRLMAWAERWAARAAARIVVISPSFLQVHRDWGTADKVTVIPNWAPVDEITPRERDNAWSREHGLSDSPTLLYSGTLGLKHNPELMVRLAARVRQDGIPVRLVVVNEGPAVDVLRASAATYDVPLLLLPFQDYARLPEVLATGDVLVVLLENEAGSFSIPSKTLSYLCAARPIVGLMPEENEAAQLLARAGCGVFRPREDDIEAAAAWVCDMFNDDGVRRDIGRRARELAECEFALDRCADRFELVLTDARSDLPVAQH